MPELPVDVDVSARPLPDTAKVPCLEYRIAFDVVDDGTVQFDASFVPLLTDRFLFVPIEASFSESRIHGFWCHWLDIPADIEDEARNAKTKLNVVPVFVHRSC